VKEPVWMDRDDAIAIHEMMLAQHGGLAGVRDNGMLESALAKPRNRFAYGTTALHELAAAYAAGIVLNHPFNDGNKRTGFMVAATFLDVNGFEILATEESVVERTVALASGTIKEATYANWLRTNAKRA
jgi:death-on-curing protein